MDHELFWISGSPTRYDKTALSFASFLNPATIRKWLLHVVNAA